MASADIDLAVVDVLLVELFLEILDYLIFDLEVCFILTCFFAKRLTLGIKLHELVLILLELVLDGFHLAGVELTISRVVLV